MSSVAVLQRVYADCGSVGSLYVISPSAPVHQPCPDNVSDSITKGPLRRDLKLDNTLLDDSDPPMLKLCDFGFAKTWTEDANMFTHIG